MTELVAFEEQRVALAFSDYLRLNGIDNQVETRSDRFAIVLHHAEQQAHARQELDAFIQNPGDAKYWQASWQTGRPQDMLKQGESPSLWRGLLARSGPFTMLVAGICVAVYLAFFWNAELVLESLRFPPGLSLEALGLEWWRLLSPAVMHYFLIHLLFNLMWWWDLGGLVERTQSTGQLIGVSLIIALVSNVAQFLSYGPNFMGLSGVVYGLLGYVWLYPRANPAVGFRLRKEIVWFMLGWLALGYSGLLDGLIGPVSNTGHSVGLIVGGVLGLAFGLLNRGRPGKPLA